MLCVQVDMDDFLLIARVTCKKINHWGRVLNFYVRQAARVCAPSGDSGVPLVALLRVVMSDLLFYIYFSHITCTVVTFSFM